jgi:acyl dehydratase
MKVVRTEELASYVGTETGRSSWFPIDQDRIDRFADVTEDRQWIHVDAAAAASGPFGATIAHGFLTLSLLSHLTAETSIAPDGAVMMINYGSDKVRYLNPVRVGSRIRAVSTLTDVTEKSPGQILLTSNVVVEIEGEDKPALVADILSLAVLAPSA